MAKMHHHEWYQDCIEHQYQGCHGQGKSSGKMKNFPGQGKVRELHFHSEKF